MIEFNKSNKYIESALNSRAIRQDLISSNIANVDTPYFRAKDLDFENLLAERAHKEFNGKKSRKLELAKTSKRHLDPRDIYGSTPTLFYRDGHMARNDGNTVDLDIETTEQAKNGVMYSALTEAWKKNKIITANAIEAGKNL